MKRFVPYMAGAMVVVAGAFGAGYALGQAKAPDAAKGVKAEVLRATDLASEMDGGAGRTLRLRRVTIEPGGATPLHDHVGKPEVTYVLSGAYTVHQDGVPDRVVNTGENSGSGINTKGGHWAENRGSVPVVFIAVDINK
jgi:quercetin dioxygenase-like cupin family protein